MTNQATAPPCPDCGGKLRPLTAREAREYRQREFLLAGDVLRRWVRWCPQCRKVKVVDIKQG